MTQKNYRKICVSSSLSKLVIANMVEKIRHIISDSPNTKINDILLRLSHIEISTETHGDKD